MLNRNILLSPDGAPGGGAAIIEPDSADAPPNSLDSFMEGVYEMAGVENPNGPTPKKDDGQPANQLAGNTGPDKSANAQAAPKPDATNKDGQQPAATKQAPDPAAAAKPAEPKAEPVGEEAWPRSAKDWDKFKTARKEEREKFQKDLQERETQLQTLTAKVKELETKATTTPEVTPESKAEVERLKGLVDEMSNRLRIVDVTSEPRFEAHFKKLTDKQFGLAKNILGEEKAKTFQDLHSLPNHPMISEWKKEKIEEFMSDLSPFEATRIGGIQNALEEIELNKQEEISKNQEYVNTLKTQATDKQKAALAGREKLFNEVVSNMGDDKVGVAVFQKKAGDDAWNQGVDARVAEAKRILFGSKDFKPQDIAKAALHAAAYPFILEAYAADRSEWEGKLAKLEAQVKEMKAAQPGNRGTSTDRTAADAPATGRFNPDTAMNPQDAIAGWMKSTITSLE